MSTPLGSLLICKPARKHPYPLVKGSHTTGLRAFHRFEGLLVRPSRLDFIVERGNALLPTKRAGVKGKIQLCGVI